MNEQNNKLLIPIFALVRLFKSNNLIDILAVRTIKCFLLLILFFFSVSLKSGNTTINSLKIDQNNKIISAGSADNNSTLEFFLVRYNDDGTLDTTFNPNGATPGIVTTSIVNASCAINSLVIDQLNRIVVTGYSKNEQNSLSASPVTQTIAVARYNYDGSLDTTFNPNSTTPGLLLLGINNTIEAGTAVAIDNNNLIVVAGDTVISNTTTSNDEATFVLRLNDDGSLDTTFNPDGNALSIDPTTNDLVITSGTVPPGTVMFDVSTTNEQASGVLIDRSNRIVVAGSAFYNNLLSPMLYRLLPDGSGLDASFNPDGILYPLGPNLVPAGLVITQPEPTSTTLDQINLGISNTSPAEFFSVAIDANNCILGAGYLDAGENTVVLVIRYNDDGTVDTSFSSGQNNIQLTGLISDVTSTDFAIPTGALTQAPIGNFAIPTGALTQAPITNIAIPTQALFATNTGPTFNIPLGQNIFQAPANTIAIPTEALVQANTPSLGLQSLYTNQLTNVINTQLVQGTNYSLQTTNITNLIGNAFTNPSTSNTELVINTLNSTQNNTSLVGNVLTNNQINNITQLSTSGEFTFTPPTTNSSLATTSEARSITIDSFNNIVVTGFTSVQNVGSNFLTVRILPTGVLDTSLEGTFQGNTTYGYIITQPGESLDILQGLKILDQANAIAVDYENNIVVGGFVNNTTSQNAVLIRYLEDGTTDTSFGANTTTPGILNISETSSAAVGQILNPLNIGAPVTSVPGLVGGVAASTASVTDSRLANPQNAFKIPVIIAENNKISSKSNQVTLNITSQPNVLITLLVDKFPITTVLSNPEGLSTITLPALPDGSYNAQAIATDAVSKLSMQSNIVSITIAAGALSQPLITFPHDNTFVGTDTVLIEGKSSPGSSVSLLINGESLDNVAKASASGSWNYLLAGKPDGQYSIGAVASAGETKEEKNNKSNTGANKSENISTLSNQVTFIKDTKPPIVPTIDKPEQEATITKESFDIAGKAKANTALTLDVNKKSIASIKVGKDGKWSYKFNKLKDGNYIVQLHTIDPVSNRKLDSVPLKFTVKLEANKKAQKSQESGESQENKNLLATLNFLPEGPTGVIKGLAKPDSFLTLIIDNNSPEIIRSNENGQWAFTPKEELSDGEHKIEIFLENNSGQQISLKNDFKV